MRLDNRYAVSTNYCTHDHISVTISCIARLIWGSISHPRHAFHLINELHVCQNREKLHYWQKQGQLHTKFKRAYVMIWQLSSFMYRMQNFLRLYKWLCHWYVIACLLFTELPNTYCTKTQFVYSGERFLAVWNSYTVSKLLMVFQKPHRIAVMRMLS